MTLSSLTGKKVRHARFGIGVITDVSDEAPVMVTVKFSDGKERRFISPDAFIGKILTDENGRCVIPEDKLLHIYERSRSDVLADMIEGKYRIDYDFGEASDMIPSLSIISDYVPTDVFWDLAVKFEYRLGRVMRRMEDESLSIAEILKNDYLNIYLTGEPGCGKTTMIEVLCAVFGLPFYVVNLSANTEEDEFIGTNKVYDGKVSFCETPFLKAFRYGGIVLLDEINAANPGVTIILNDVLIRPFTIYENNIISRKRHPLCIIAAASNPDTVGICRMNEATERRFNVAKILKAPGKDEIVALLANEGYNADMAAWAYSAYDRCRTFLKENEADEIYRALSIDSIRAVLNDIEEGMDSVSALDNFVARAAARDPETADQLRILCRSIVRFRKKGCA